MTDFVYEEGDLVDTGSHGQDDLLYIDGVPAPNEGESSLVFEVGTGLGGGNMQIYASGSVVESANYDAVEDSRTPSDFYGYDTDNNVSASDDTLVYCSPNYMSVFKYEDTGNGERYLFVVFDHTSGSGGSMNTDVTGDTSGASFVVEDEPGEVTYAFGTDMSHGWTSGRTDGYVVGPFTSGDTVRVDVNSVSGLSDVQCMNNDQSTIEHPISSDVAVEVTF